MVTFHPEILKGSHERRRQTRKVGKTNHFSGFKRRYLENGMRYGQSYY